MKGTFDTISSLWDGFVSLIFPETCLLCNDVLQKNELQICTFCTIDLPVTNYHKSINDNPVFNDLKLIENLSAAGAFLKYNRHGKAQKLLQELKYRGNYEIGFLLGKMYGSHLKKVIKADMMVPLPIHKSKLKTRGYNQSQAICEGIQYHMDIPIDTISVIRSAKTSTQTKKDKANRWLSMQGVFDTIAPENIENRNILIIDDVITTGATIFSLCDEINQYNPKSLLVFSIASGK